VNRSDRGNSPEVGGTDSLWIFQYPGAKEKENCQKRLNSTNSIQIERKTGTSKDQGSNDNDWLSAQYK
jgi:hypothetical protein